MALNSSVCIFHMLLLCLFEGTLILCQWNSVVLATVTWSHNYSTYQGDHSCHFKLIRVQLVPTWIQMTQGIAVFSNAACLSHFRLHRIRTAFPKLIMRSKLFVQYQYYHIGTFNLTSTI